MDQLLTSQGKTPKTRDYDTWLRIWYTVDSRYLNSW